MRFIFADTETTHAREGAAVCEVGWIETDSGFEELGRVESLIDPQSPICPSASGIHGIVDADVQDKPTMGEFFTSNHEMCWGKLIDGDVTLIGHSIAFDKKFLAPYIPNMVGEICTLRWSRRLWPDAPDHKLSTMKYLLNLPRGNGDSHRVMVDVEDALNLTKAICEKAELTLTQLAEESKKPFLVEYAAFGKHKGEHFSDVPKSYLRWMSFNMEMDKDLAHTVAFYLQQK